MQYNVNVCIWGWSMGHIYFLYVHSCIHTVWLNYRGVLCVFHIWLAYGFWLLLYLWSVMICFVFGELSSSWKAVALQHQNLTGPQAKRLLPWHQHLAGPFTAVTWAVTWNTSHHGIRAWLDHEPGDPSLRCQSFTEPWAGRLFTTEPEFHHGAIVWPDHEPGDSSARFDQAMSWKILH